MLTDYDVTWSLRISDFSINYFYEYIIFLSADYSFIKPVVNIFSVYFIISNIK